MQRLGPTVPANNKPNLHLWAICVELGKSTFAAHSGLCHLLPHSPSISTGTNLEFQLEGKTLLETVRWKKKTFPAQRWGRAKRRRRVVSNWGGSLLPGGNNSQLLLVFGPVGGAKYPLGFAHIHISSCSCGRQWNLAQTFYVCLRWCQTGQIINTRKRKTEFSTYFLVFTCCSVIESLRFIF